MNLKLPAHDVERLRSVNALLQVALSMPESAREVWLQTLPAHQQPFIATLNAMLGRAALETGAFLRRPADGLLAKAIRAVGPQAGEDIGPYRLIRQLGAGGMATVWLAERSDGLLRRQVALKLPHAVASPVSLPQEFVDEFDVETLNAALYHNFIS
jgi:eukaryotic-like serine/threonine-protein kinase